MIALETAELRKSFKQAEVLRGISLQVAQGEIFGLVGADGAGKTTFIRTALGLYLPDGGSTRLLGGDPAAAKSRVGYVPQQFSLNVDMTVWENIALFARLQGLPGEEWPHRAKELLGMLWLDDFRERLADDLSGGMKQKLALICGVIHRPQVLFLDEPTTGVDPVSRREFWQMLYRLNRDGLTVVISTPYMEEASLCGRIAFFDQGRVCALGRPEELLSSYPCRLFAVRAGNLRAFLPKLEQLPAKSVYLQGGVLRVALADGQEAGELESALRAGLGDFTLEQIQPELEDLFSILSQEAGE